MSSGRSTGRDSHEAAADIRGGEEPEHPRGAGRAPGQADRGLHGPLHPHRDVRPSERRSGRARLAVHQWSAPATP